MDVLTVVALSWLVLVVFALAILRAASLADRRAERLRLAEIRRRRAPAPARAPAPRTRAPASDARCGDPHGGSGPTVTFGRKRS
jgi:hypothetical protein